MPYHRVVPRDLFNEADLLKCLGRLWVALDETHGHTAALNQADEGAAFSIDQDESSGAIFVAGVVLTIADEQQTLYRPLNSRAPWPLWLGDTGGDDIRVFNEDGTLSADFRARIGAES